MTQQQEPQKPEIPERPQHRVIPKKPSREGFVALCIALAAIAILLASGLNLLIRYKSGSVSDGSIRFVKIAVVLAGAAATASILTAILGFRKRYRKRGTTFAAIALSLLMLLGSLAAVYEYAYIFGSMIFDNGFQDLSADDLGVVQIEKDGELNRKKTGDEQVMNFEDIALKLQGNENVELEVVRRSLLTNDDMPEDARKAFHTGEPTGKSYLSPESDKISNFLLFGLDAAGSSDSIMLVSLDRVHKKIKIISIARDSYVKIPEWGMYAKLTYAYHWGQAEMAVRTINTNYFLNVEDYVAVNFDQLAQIVDYIGGVDVEIDASEQRYMRGFADVTIGMNHLDGATAVSYARIRKSNFSDSDKNRTGRQREVLMSMFSSVSSMPLGSYPQFLRDCLGMCTTSFETDQLMQMMLEVAGGNYTIEQYFFPEGQVDWWGGLVNDLFYYVYDLSRASDRMYRIIYEDLYTSGYAD
ncbi:MAG: LCP family protein [Oscillospiraceae bacterium]|nr:LCP family protein [Oscillospiraceae bacterium]